MTIRLGANRSECVKDAVPSDGGDLASENISGTDWFQLGTDGSYEAAVNPTVAAMLDWVYASGTTLNVRCKVSVNGTDWQWAPSYGAASSGQSTASIAQLNFTASTWDIGDSTTARLPVAFDIPGWTYFQIWAKSNSATGSISGDLAVGRGG